MDVERIGELWSGLREGVGQVIVGQEETMRLMMVALLTGGHVLLEGLPGTGKTLLAQAFASALRLDFKRIQFTPDLMPGDVVGTNLFNFQTNEFRLTRGPLFTEFLLADEINRTPPKTQSALLEAMQERRVTIDGETYPLSKAFIVVATQNPIEHEGTYPLPEAQLDRFLFHIQVESPDREQEIDMVRRHATRPAYDVAESLREAAVTDRDTILAARDAVSALRIADELVDYVVDLVRATRDQPSLRYGASPRTIQHAGRCRPRGRGSWRDGRSSSPMTSRASCGRRCAIAWRSPLPPRSRGKRSRRSCAASSTRCPLRDEPDAPGGEVDRARPAGRAAARAGGRPLLARLVGLRRLGRTRLWHRRFAAAVAAVDPARPRPPRTSVHR